MEDRDFPKEKQVMKLNEKIRDRKVVYLFRKQPEIAFQLALLYFVLAKRKKARKKVLEACQKSVYWLKIAKVKVSHYLNLLSPFGQLEEIEKILVNNKAILPEVGRG